MRDTVTISAGALRAEIVPSLGGGLTRFDLVDGATVLPVFRPWPDGGADNPNQLACYVLVPWSNRISLGGFRFGGDFHALEPNVADEPCPLHGDGWTSRWQVSAANATSTALSLSSTGSGPFRYDATIGYALDASALTMSLTAWNRAGIPLPYGLGFHPWLPRTPGTTLQAAASTVWLEDSRHLPDGSTLVSSGDRWDFSRPRALPPVWVNNGFSGWSGRARIEWPDRDLAVDIAASDQLSTYILFSPGGEADFFCFEPVSHPVDAHNLPGGAEANGLAILQPGEALSVRCRFEVRRPQTGNR
jgi:aldose 1-epimerase